MCVMSFPDISTQWVRFHLYEVMNWSTTNHDDVIQWKHFPRYWPCVRGIHRSPVNSPHKGQWRGALKFSLICTRINGWVNYGEVGDLRRHRAYYDVTVMYCHTGDVRDQCLSTHDIDLLLSWTIRIRFILLWNYVCDSIAIDYVLNITILVRVTLVVLGYSGKLGQHPTTTKHNKTSTWLRHQMETFSVLLDFRAGNSPVTDEFPTQRPVTRSFDIFFDLRLIKLLSKQSRLVMWDAIVPIMTSLWWNLRTVLAIYFIYIKKKTNVLGLTVITDVLNCVDVGIGFKRTPDNEWYFHRRGALWQPTNGV